MKSAINRQVSMVMALLLCAMTALFAYGCGAPTFLPSYTEEQDPQDGSTPNLETPAPPNGDAVDVPTAPIYYDYYTGLACEESVSSCRPLSICIGNFDGKRQEGLSFADILIEAPVGGRTSFWGISARFKEIPVIGNITAAADYTLPSALAFGAIPAYLGLTGSNGEALAPYAESIDASLGHAAYFSKDGDHLTTDGERLQTAAVTSGYPLRAERPALPFRFAPSTERYVPSGNEITSISFRFGEGIQVGFGYDAAANTYLRTQNGTPHTDAEGNPLRFENVLLLLHDVTYTHTAGGTHYTLSSENGGCGYCYTGGRAVSVSWHYNEAEELVITDKEGEPITLNRGKTYIGLIKITDSATIVAR